jgi:hypothetical protein
VFASSSLFSPVSIADRILLLLGATIVFLSSQVTFIFNFFLSRNLRIARERAWQQTVASRGKGPTFWQPYVEEWDVPPKVNVDQWAGLAQAKNKAFGFAVKRSELAYSFYFMSRFDNIHTLNSRSDSSACCPGWWVACCGSFQGARHCPISPQARSCLSISPPFL